MSRGSNAFTYCARTDGVSRCGSTVMKIGWIRSAERPDFVERLGDRIQSCRTSVRTESIAEIKQQPFSFEAAIGHFRSVRRRQAEMAADARRIGRWHRIC